MVALSLCAPALPAGNHIVTLYCPLVKHSIPNFLLVVVETNEDVSV